MLLSSWFVLRNSKFEVRTFNLYGMKLFTIPNLLTLGNLFCGCLAILFLTGQFGGDIGSISVAVLILLSISLFFDLLDGMVARAMKINSEIGVQLDSLADMVSFGVVPSFSMMTLLQDSVETSSYLQYSGLLITLFSALRLAKFNVDTEQSTYFKGLNTPANTILIFSLFWIQNQNGFIISKEFDIYILIGITILSCWLLISNIPIFSFKFKGFAWKDNHYKYVFLIISIILLALFQITALPFIILLYILISIIFRKKIVHA